ncbi:MAG: glutathione S-transferase family protein [Deltaproteobacteria bacterium]|nr:glutathione S-transferase family protein [Deltaproteobacteria bacterium]
MDNQFTCYAFAAVPPFAQGLVRDLRVRWALEEAELPYHVALVGGGTGAVSPADYAAIQPFGQIPALRHGDLTMFESGAIVLHVAEQSRALLPSEPQARAHVQQWMFAALNTVESPVQELAGLDLFHAGAGWAAERRPAVEERVRQRLAQLTACLKDGEYLVGAFSAADILMASVLRILRHTELVAEQPRLLAYLRRCEARPAFRRALEGQMAAFAA